jgi:hypothetical protein
MLRECHDGDTEKLTRNAQTLTRRWLLKSSFRDVKAAFTDPATEVATVPMRIGPVAAGGYLSAAKRVQPSRAIRGNRSVSQAR